MAKSRATSKIGEDRDEGLLGRDQKKEKGEKTAGWWTVKPANGFRSGRMESIIILKKEGGTSKKKNQAPKPSRHGERSKQTLGELRPHKKHPRGELKRYPF